MMKVRQKKRQRRTCQLESLEERRLLAAIGSWLEPNLGQYASESPAVFRGPNYVAEISAARATLQLPSRTDGDHHLFARSEATPAPQWEPAIVELLGANAQAPLQTAPAPTATVDYLFGNSPDDWWNDIPALPELRFEGVYDSIDVKYRSRPQGSLEQVFHIHPHGNVNNIRIHFANATAIGIDDSGSLLVDVGSQQLIDSPPLAYQIIDGAEVSVPVHYRLLSDKTIGFELGAYDKTYSVEIDPILSRGQFAGGSGSDRLNDLIIDPAGNRYFAGRTFSTDLVTRDAAQGTPGGLGDAFIVKHDRFGSLRKATYFGGNAFDTIESLSFDAVGRIAAVGWTASTNFPTRNARQANYGGGLADGVVVVLDDNLNLVHSSFMGGQGTDRLRGVAADTAGNVVVAGHSDHDSFPTLNSLQPFAGGSDIVVARLNAAGDLLASTFWGGNGNDVAAAVAVGATGIFVTGHTTSINFPTAFPLQTGLAGKDDVVLSKFAANLDSVLFSTYTGDADTDQAADIVLDALDNAIVIGSSGSVGSSSNGDATVRKYAASGSSILFSTRIGGTAKDEGRAAALDREGRIHVTGTRFAGSLFFPITADAFQAAYGGGLTDAFLTTLDANGVVVFSSNLGGSSDDSGQAIGVEFSGDLVVAGNTLSNDFPRGGSQPLPLGGAGDVFLSTIVDQSRSMDWTKLQQRAFALSHMRFVRPEPVAIDQLDPPANNGGRDDLGMVFQESLLVSATNVLDGLPAPLDKFYVGVRPRAALNRLALDVYTDHDLNGRFDRRFYDQQNVNYSHPDIRPAINAALIPDAGRILSEIFIGREQSPGNFPIFLNVGANAFGRFNSFEPQTVGSSFRVAAHKILNADEDFPLIREMYVRILDQQRASILALVDSGAATAALSMELIPGPTTTLLVDAMWYPRALIVADNPEFAVIAYSSLFWQDERDTPQDSTDEAHDLDHLVIGFDANDDGIIDNFVDRRINNPPNPGQIEVTRFEDPALGKPLLMALENRDRDPAHYSRFASADYASRASYQVEIQHSDVPLAVRLFEAATDSEFLDNIVAAAVIKQDLPKPTRFEDGYRVRALHRAFFPPANHLPVISQLQDVHVATNAPIPPLAFTVADVETASAQLQVSAQSSNPALIPNAQLVVNGANGQKTLTITAAPGITGTSQITVTVRDEGGATTSTTFQVSVAAPWQNPRNRLDVNDDGIVNPFDALLVIKDLHAKGSRTLDAPTAETKPPPFIDVNGDNRSTPFDAVLIVSHIARRNAGSEGESSPQVARLLWLPDQPMGTGILSRVRLMRSAIIADVDDDRSRRERQAASLLESESAI